VSGNRSGFVDECQLNVRGGDGGAGCIAFRREGPVAMGGPNGGDGGKGGDVWLVADHNVASLLAFRDHPHRRAGNGVHGKGKDLHGKRGEDQIVTVPEGTVVSDLYSGEVLAELLHHGDRWLAAAGGRGGRGNARFLSNRRRAPSFAEQGEYGEEHWLKLEMRLMADVALVGFPNVGKSTLIATISKARPKVADYPFTTLVPNLGVVSRGDERSFVVADIPGLIEGAAEGAGLGHRFLKHIERTRVLLILVSTDPSPGRSLERDLATLRGELERFDPELAARPSLVAVSKLDLPEVQEALPEFMRTCASLGVEVSAFSAATREGVDTLLDRIEALLDQHPLLHKPRAQPLPNKNDRPHAAEGGDDEPEAEATPTTDAD